MTWRRPPGACALGCGVRLLVWAIEPVCSGTSESPCSMCCPCCCNAFRVTRRSMGVGQRSCALCWHLQSMWISPCLTHITSRRLVCRQPAGTEQQMSARGLRKAAAQGRQPSHGRDYAPPPRKITQACMDSWQSQCTFQRGVATPLKYRHVCPCALRTASLPGILLFL